MASHGQLGTYHLLGRCWWWQWWRRRWWSWRWWWWSFQASDGQPRALGQPPPAGKMRNKLRLFQIQSPLSWELITREGPQHHSLNWFISRCQDRGSGVRVLPIITGSGLGVGGSWLFQSASWPKDTIWTETWAIISLIDGPAAAPPFLNQFHSSVTPKSDRSFSPTDHLTREHIWECQHPLQYHLQSFLMSFFEYQKSISNLVYINSICEECEKCVFSLCFGDLFDCCFLML